MVNLPHDYKKYYFTNIYFIFYTSLLNWSFSWKIKVNHPMVHLHGIVHLWKIERTEKQKKHIFQNENNTFLLHEPFSTTIYNIYYDSINQSYFILCEYPNENNQKEKYKKIILTLYDDVMNYMWLYVKCKSPFIISIKEKQLLVDGIGNENYTHNSKHNHNFIIDHIEEHDWIDDDLVI